MSKLIRGKLIPINNPNYQIKETAEELLEIVKNNSNIPVISANMKECCDNKLPITWSNDNVIGLVADKETYVHEPTIEDGWIFGDILLFNSNDSDKQWTNAMVTVDDNMYITSFNCVEYN